jgi:mono/diheme cytochrome c family protein
VWALVVCAVRAEDTAQNAGEDAYLRFCAVCHGTSGQGDGAFANLLKSSPPNLTLLAEANGGVFPTRRVEHSIDGRGMPLAHGTRDMPIWGRTWKRDDPTAGEAAVHSRAIAIVAYLRAIQQESSE